MGINTLIQWCDGTVNPIMGCAGCELFPAPADVLRQIDQALIGAGIESWQPGRARVLVRELIDEAWQALLDGSGEPGPGHTKRMSLTNLYHLRRQLSDRISQQHGRRAGTIVLDAINGRVKCYAARLHLNKAHSIFNPRRQANIGYAPSFEQVTRFEGRMRIAAAWPDLLGTEREGSPWLNGLPRLIFVSDMGDALSRKSDFHFLKPELRDTQGDEGRRHIWLWLTKRPHLMQQFAESIGGLPDNFCAMTTVTSHSTLHRVDELRKVDAAVRGLSLEPLWSGVADQLDLTGIDWVIAGGESGAKATVTPFPIEWAEELAALCRDQGVAFFLKQLGRNPIWNGSELRLTNEHGGDWDEWDESLRIREFPERFHCYRRDEIPAVAGLID